MFISAEWEANKNAEPAKEVSSQPLSAEPTAASSAQTETYNQPVAMMPVQVPSPPVEATAFDCTALIVLCL